MKFYIVILLLAGFVQITNSQTWVPYDIEWQTATYHPSNHLINNNEPSIAVNSTSSECFYHGINF